MRASPFATLPAFSTLIALITTLGTVTSDLAGGICDVTISDETELRWSEEHHTFVTNSPDSNGSWMTQWQPEKNSSLCIRAPERHRILLHISLNISDVNSLSTEHSSFCNASFPHECKATCLLIREPELRTNKTLDFESTQNGVFEVLRDIKFEFFKLNYTYRSSVANSSKVDENIERLRRFSLPHFNNSSHNDSPTSRNFDKRGTRRRKRHRCRKCSSKGLHASGRKRTKRRRNVWKEIAANLLLEYHKRWLVDQEDAAKRKESGEAVRKSLSPESKEARDRILRFIDSTRRRRKLSPVESLQRTPTFISKSLERLPQEVVKAPYFPAPLPTGGKTKRPLQRRRRLALKSTTSPPASENPLFRLSNFSFCGPEAFFRDKEATGGSTKDRNQREFPISLHSIGREMRIEIPHPISVDDPLLSMLKIKIAFSHGETEVTDFQIATTNSVSKGNVPPTRTHQLSSSATVANNTMTGSIITTTREQALTSSNDSVHITIGVAMGGLLVCVSAVFCLACLYRRKKSALFEAEDRRRDLVDESETEKCLASVENLKSHPDYNSQRSPERRQNLIEVNERRMLEHKKHKHSHRKPGKVKRKEDVTDSRKTHEAKQQQQSRQHVTQCKHLLTMRGSSRHEHCIVCQIAGKPHPPIMNAQYASEFLPPASRHNNNSGYNASPHDNFDKFNRMQNNPYRHSPSLTPKNAASPPCTIKLPDGEEGCRSRRDLKLHGDRYRSPMPVCVKPPPNRTIFASEPLPFSPSSRQKLPGKVSGYPGPPTSVSKTATFERSADCGGHRSRTAAPREDCICRYILNHIDEPPPEYSDVIKDPLPLEAEGTASNTGSPELGSRKNDVSSPLPNT